MYDKYKLSDEQHNAVLNKICRNLFYGKTPAANPQIFILGGQPGAGKSILTERSYHKLGNSNFVVINSDEFRTQHPNAQEIFDNHDKDFAAYTDPDVRVWGSEIFDAAIKGRYNIIFEGTMRTTQICETIKRLQAEKYMVNILAMAVPEIKSRISIYARYQEQLENYPIARFTSRFSHDAAYHGMLDTLQKIENEKLYDAITICNRNGDVLFKTGDKNVVNAIKKEREKPLSASDASDLLQDCNVLLKKMTERGESPEYIEDLQALQQQVRQKNLNERYETCFSNIHNMIHEVKNSDTCTAPHSKETSYKTPTPKNHER